MTQDNNGQSLEEQKTCDRCYAYTEKFYDLKYTDDCGDLQLMKICFDCENDLINGNEIECDPSELYFERKQQAYEYDPINNEKPIHEEANYV